MYKWKLNPVQSGEDSQYGEMLLISQINLKNKNKTLRSESQEMILPYFYTLEFWLVKYIS